MDNIQFEKIYDQLVKEAKEFKDTISSFKTVGDVQKEIKGESELFKHFMYIGIDYDIYDEDKYILYDLTAERPIDYIRFETVEPDFESEERKELATFDIGQFFVDYPTYYPTNDSFYFDIYFENDENAAIENLTLSKKDLSRLKRELKEYITSIEEDMEEEI